ncbi:S-layer homology domain-containing protein [Paenibacillus eucommiae]|nr:S-layer homology domain-containing protein [Paenibacillus eucommiae]
MKKKIVVTTMAASLLFGAATGLPLSKKEVASQLGFSTGVAFADADQLKDETPEKKAELLAAARTQAEEAVKKMAIIDVSKAITIVGDKATLKLNVGDLVKQIAEINKQVNALNETLKSLDPNAVGVKAEFRLDLGTIIAKTTEIPLPKELFAALKDNGIATLDILNGLRALEMSISSTEFSDDMILVITKQDKTVATNKTIVSDVYKFEFKHRSSGAIVSKFTKPIRLMIPITNSFMIDIELLTLAKIVDDKLIILVGKYKDEHLEATQNSFSTYTVVENKTTFGDTAPVQQWAGRQIQVAAAKGILEGREANLFVPNGKVTRAEFAKMIVKTFGLEDEAATESFKDVKASDWFKMYVASAVKHGIVNGRAEGVFDPNGQITRAEMATMAARALTLTGTAKSVADVDAALKGFVDAATVNASLKAGVALAASEGIIIGEEGNKFNPNADSTRAQAAVVIYRLLNK